MSIPISFNFTAPKWDLAFTFHVEGEYTPGDPGNTYGPPELCYPPEGNEFMLEEFSLTAINGVELPESFDCDPGELEERVYDEADKHYTWIQDRD